MQNDNEPNPKMERQQREPKHHNLLICYRCWANSGTRRSRLHPLWNGETNEQLRECAHCRHGVDAGGDGGWFDVYVYADWSPE